MTTLHHEPGFYVFCHGQLVGPFERSMNAANYGLRKWGEDAASDAVVFEVKAPVVNKEESMDPNEALNELRKLVAIVNDGGTPDGTPSPRETVQSMAELFDGLDDWLSNGGFLPAAWEVNR